MDKAAPKILQAEHQAVQGAKELPGVGKQLLQKAQQKGGEFIDKIAPDVPVTTPGLLQETEARKERSRKINVLDPEFELKTPFGTLTKANIDKMSMAGAFIGGLQNVGPSAGAQTVNPDFAKRLFRDISQKVGKTHPQVAKQIAGANPNNIKGVEGFTKMIRDILSKGKILDNPSIQTALQNSLNDFMTLIQGGASPFI